MCNRDGLNKKYMQLSDDFFSKISVPLNTYLYNMHMKINSNVTNLDIAIIFLLREIMENIYSMRILYRSGCVSPAINIARTIYELDLQLQFLLINDNPEKAAICYRIFPIWKNMRNINKLIKSHEQQMVECGKEHLVDNHENSLALLDEALKKENEKYLLIKGTCADEIRKQLNELPAIKHYNSWFTVCNNRLTSIRKLAELVDVDYEHFETNYNYYSEQAHGYQATNRLVKTDDGNIALKSFSNYKNGIIGVDVVLSRTINAIDILCTKHRYKVINQNGQEKLEQICDDEQRNKWKEYFDDLMKLSEKIRKIDRQIDI